jgi:PAS domain S-box-containing protein
LALGVVFENAPVGFARCTLQGRIAQVNASFERMLGCSQNLLTSCHLQDLIPGKNDLETQGLFSELAAGRRKTYQIEKRYLGQGGKSGWANLVAWLVVDAAGNPDFVLVAAEDTTERKRMQDGLRETQRMEAVGRLAGAAWPTTSTIS